MNQKIKYLILGFLIAATIFGMIFIIFYEGDKTEALPDDDSPNDTDKNEEINGTDGIIYELLEKAESYRIIGYEGTDDTIIIPDSYNGKPIKSIFPSAFENCQQITSVIINNSSSEFHLLGSAFANCTNLQTVDFSNCTFTSLGGFAFEGCINLRNIKLPDTLTMISSYDFYGCTNLTEITLPSSLEEIGPQAFANTGLIRIDLPEGLKEIGRGAFGNTAIRRITFPSTLEKYAGCLEKHADSFASSTLVEMTIKGAVINENCFSSESVDSLRTLIIEGDVKQIPDNAFGNNEFGISVTVYYHGTKDEFKAITNEEALKTWRFEAIHCSDGVIEN